MSIEADPALGVPYGNDLQFPGVFGFKVVFVCCSRRALSHIGVGLMGCCPEIFTCVGICGRVMHRDLSFLFQEGRSMNVAVSSVLTAAE